MTSLTLPFAPRLDAATGDVEPQGPITERRVSDLQGLIADEAAWRRAVDHGNPIVYRVVAAPVPEIAGELPFSITTIEPGAIGDEYYMTKGHAHTAPEGELYVGLVGRGVLLLHDGRETRAVEMGPGVAGYVPPGWAHRTVNVANEPFRFLAVYPGTAGHDYEAVARTGMGARVVRSTDGYRVTPDQDAPSSEPSV
jgi:glucose-6-phosphate isomerase, archaeal